MIEILFIIFLILVIGLFAGLETGSYTINKIKLRHRALHNDKEALLLTKNLSDPQTFIFTTLIFQNIFIYIISILATNCFLSYGIGGEQVVFIFNFIPWSSEIAATLILTLPLFIFGEVGPKNLFRVNADTLMYRFSRLQYICIFLCKPFTVFLKYFARLLTPNRSGILVGELQNLTQQKMSFFFAEGHRSGVITKQQNNMIINAMNLKTIPVTKLMVPINNIISFSTEDSPEGILSAIKYYRYNMIPLYSDIKEKKNITGTINILDLIRIKTKNMHSLEPYISNIISVRQKMNIQEVYDELHERNHVMALVKNNRDKTTGIIWLKDIIKSMSKDNLKNKPI